MVPRLPLVALLALFLTLVVGSCAAPVTPALEVSPDSGTFVAGQRVKVSVTRRFPSGTADDVTLRVVPTSTNRGIVRVEGRDLVLGEADTGTATLRFHDPDSEADVTLTLTVVPRRVVEIDITPSPAIVLRPGESQQFTATGRYADGSTEDVTSKVQWTSSNPAAAIVGRTPTEVIGFVRAVADGDTTIVATDAATLVQGRSIVFVRGGSAQLRSILVTPNPAVIPLAGTMQFGAVGVFSDGSSRSVTVKWSSSRTDVATIDAGGLATGVLAGDTTITATVDDGAAPVRGSAAAKVQ